MQQYALHIRPDGPVAVAATDPALSIMEVLSIEYLAARKLQNTELCLEILTVIRHLINTETLLYAKSKTKSVARNTDFDNFATAIIVRSQGRFNEAFGANHAQRQHRGPDPKPDENV